jgi:hypothetical protein
MNPLNFAFFPVFGSGDIKLFFILRCWHVTDIRNVHISQIKPLQIIWLVLECLFNIRHCSSADDWMAELILWRDYKEGALDTEFEPMHA